MATKKAEPKDAAMRQAVVISAPNFQTVDFVLTGTAPYVQNKWGAKARAAMKKIQELGSVGKKNKKREPKNFKLLFQQAQYRTPGGWCGIPAPAFRNAMVSACKICGYMMTRAKLGVFIEADGYDSDEGTPLVKFTKGKPQYAEHPVRLANGSFDLRPRPMWKEGWQCKLRITFDADMFSVDDIANLIHRVSRQVGVGEGRPDSKNSCGMGWGLFSVGKKASRNGRRP